MIDIKINNSGDIVTEDNEIMAALSLSWKNTKNPAVKLSFNTGIMPPQENANSNSVSEPFCMIFNATVDKSSTVLSSCTEDEEIRQRILLLIRANPGIVRQKHKDITDPLVLAEIENTVMNQVRPILENPSVQIKRNEYDGVFSWQNLSVYIYDGSQEIYNFQLEG